MEVASLQEYVDVKILRIRSYIRHTIKSAQIRAEGIYNDKFDFFYKWTVGKLSGKEIKDTLIVCLNQNAVPRNVIDCGDETVHRFAMLLENYKLVAGSTTPDMLIREDWLKVKNNYERQLKIEICEVYDNTLIDNNIGISEHKEDKHGEDNIINDDIMELLQDVYQGNWFVKSGIAKHEKFNYMTGIANFSIPQDIQSTVLNSVLCSLRSFFSKNYGANQFTIKESADGKYFIEGLFNYSL